MIIQSNKERVVMNALATDQSLDGIGLSKTICETYAEACEEEGKGDEITLSVVNLENFGKLYAAYGNIGINALASACEDPKFLSRFGRAASKAEKYGSASRNLIDLGSLVRNAESILLPENSQCLLDALESSVAYQVSGPYRSKSSGLSCYYPLEMDECSVMEFASATESEPYKHLFEFALTGRLSDDGAEYASAMEYLDAGYLSPEEDAAVELDEPLFMDSLGTLGLEDYPVYIDEDGCATLDLGSGIADILTGVFFELAYVDAESDIIMMLGRDNDIVADWDRGVFKDNFRSAWAALDGSIVCMELTQKGDNCNLYSIPITLNGERCDLSAAYDFDTAQYRILGARGVTESGLSDKNLRKLQPGDEIETMLYALSISGDDTEPELFVSDSLTVTKRTALKEADLGDGMYALLFEMADTAGNSALSDLVLITVENGIVSMETDYAAVRARGKRRQRRASKGSFGSLCLPFFRFQRCNFQERCHYALQLTPSNVSV
jgi:hypothetical protein